MRSPYRFFSPLNRRRGELIARKYKGGLTEREISELKMLQAVIGAMAGYAHQFMPSLAFDQEGKSVV